MIQISMTELEWQSIALSIIASSRANIENGFRHTAAEERFNASKIYTALGDESNAKAWQDIATITLLLTNKSKENEA